MKFLAILKDSLREALDGWVIYVMLGMSLVLILFVASFSFEPVPAQEAFDSIARKFVIVYPDRGESNLARPFPFVPKVTGLEQTNSATSPQEGDYKFVLRIEEFDASIAPPTGDAAANPELKKAQEESRKRSNVLKAVTFWSRPGNPNQMFANRDVEVGDVTDEMFVEFVRDQFTTHGNMDVSKVALRPVKGPPAWEFDIETRGMKGAKGWPHHPRVFFGLWKIRLPITLGMWVYFLESSLLSDIGASLALLVSVIITAFFIPNMMRKGSIDLLLSKPMSRWRLLMYKYIGGMTFVLINTTFAVVGVWIAIGLRTGIWGTGLLWTIPAITFYFAILYAVSTLASVLTRNAIVAILATTMFWGALFVVGFIHNKLDPLRNEKALEIPSSVFTVMDTVNAVLPRTTDLDNLMNKLISNDTLGRAEQRTMKKDKLSYPHWGEVLGVSGLYIAVMLGLSCWRFSARDY